MRIMRFLFQEGTLIMNGNMIAETIILQAIDDLYDATQRAESVDFFTGEGFAECAAMAGMDQDMMMGVLEIVSIAVSGAMRPGFRDICVNGDYGWVLRGGGSRAQGMS
jgi:hypothetical protein